MRMPGGLHVGLYMSALWFGLSNSNKWLWWVWTVCRFAWSEGWRPPGAESVLINWTRWILAMAAINISIIMMMMMMMMMTIIIIIMLLCWHYRRIGNAVQHVVIQWLQPTFFIIIIIIIKTPRLTWYTIRYDTIR